MRKTLSMPATSKSEGKKKEGSYSCPDINRKKKEAQLKSIGYEANAPPARPRRAAARNANI